jgi:regulator of protease activity HflC (stomatin/prohibitin superfamily)
LIFLFIIGLLIVVLGVLFGIGMGRPLVMVGSALFGIMLVFVSMFGTVSTKNVGVVTSFNKPTGEIKQAGAYMIAPWKSVTEMDLAWQTEGYPVSVQAAAGTTVGLDVRPRWRMVATAAPDLFQNYRSFEGVKNNLFKTELVDAANMLFASYNPLTNIDVKTGEAIKTKEQWAADLKKELEKRLAGKVEFERVAIPTIAPDPKTQEKLNQQVEEFGKGKVLDQQKVNADKQKLITETNASVDKESRCLEIAAANGGEPGLCLSAGAGVILNKTK